jgi:secondary thiamine-phosphate synthase enzyme
VRQAIHTISVSTLGSGLVEFTPALADWIGAQAIETGLITLFCRRTSASLILQGTEADMLADLQAFFARLAPEGDLYTHDRDGPDDMPAHIRAALTQTHIAIPVVCGQLALSSSQGVFIFEHRRAPQMRQVLIHLSGE